MENENDLQDLERRKSNLEVVIQVAEEELYFVMEKIKKLMEYRPVWFKINNKKNGKD